MKTAVEKNCRRCGRLFTVLASEVKRGSGLFCSRGCACRKTPTMPEFLASMVGHSGCWEFPGKRDEWGYAYYSEKDTPSGRAHRVAYAISNKDWPPTEIHIRHSCDNPPCCNPDHLSRGTAKDNYEDARSRDRHTRGERQAASKLTAEQVLAIRADTRIQVAIAAEYGILQTTVSEIKQHHRWKHLI